MEVHPKSELLHDFSPRFKVYNDGSIQRLPKDDIVPPSFDPITRVHSKDVAVSSTGLSCRVYLPDNVSESTKLPLLIYIHGGAFCVYSAFSSIYHAYVNALVSHSHVIAVSPDYRLAPEHPIPACYDDCWTATRWVAAHAGRAGQDPWINQWADFNRVYLAGDSAGENIAHEMVVRAGPDGLIGPGARVAGLALVHPFFGKDANNLLWEYLCRPAVVDAERDVRLDPGLDPTRLRREMGCGRVLVCVGEQDFLKGKGVKYYEGLRREGWKGEVRFWESKGKGHVFHLYKPDCDEAIDLLRCVATFIAQPTSLL